MAELLQVLVKVCDAVSRAHIRGVLHRDLTPTDIIVSDVGQVYVVGWRMAWWSDLDRPGSVVGTPCYMAPELLLGKHAECDERTDTFAFGATLYQVLTGAPPLTAEIVRAIWTRRDPAAVTPPDQLVAGGQVPPELSRIAMRAIAYKAHDRYVSVAELKQELEAYQRRA
jgi:serine/threonine protein kinase